MAPTAPLQPQVQLPEVGHNEALHEPQAQPQTQQLAGQSKDSGGLHAAATSPERHLACPDLPPNARLVAQFLSDYPAQSSQEEVKVFTLHPADFNALEANEFCQHLLGTKAHHYDYLPRFHRLTLTMTTTAFHDRAAHLLNGIILKASRAAFEQVPTPPSLTNARLERGYGASKVSIEQDGIEITSSKLSDGMIVFRLPGKVIPAF
ncbi:hypothetical protein PG994_001029 [Apiospora phragmitis]|uniref:Uncharacterized protein n=1 Tax=Apiospora phragmitis TaxID=2905665 RepID=A0ABR1WR93_9PEZI